MDQTSVTDSAAPPSFPEVADEHKELGTILLFYQYKEPVWTASEHKAFLKQFLALATHHGIYGRGRVAPEGVNCTLSSPTPISMRQFCLGLRSLDATLFGATDFKLTDGIPAHQLFKRLSIRKTNELVAYGMAGAAKAPSLQQFAGQHLEADEYHKALQDKDAVVIDVRNAYETAIGTFAPPQDGNGGAQLIDPKMRNSIEWPKWLADPETQKKLHGKKILTFCTGGIRCERATALINEMSVANSSTFQPKGVYELKGGIERYLKKHPDGGFWKGKNYLFDRRMEQIPANKSMEAVEKEINTCCCVCRTKWTVYRGKHKCSRGLCGVPVIVCKDCQSEASQEPSKLICELCRQGYKTQTLAPDLVGLKRKAESSLFEKNLDNNENVSTAQKDNTATNWEWCADRLFISRLPRIMNRTRLTEWLGGDVETVVWLTDQQTGAFYGSCIVQMESTEAASLVQARRPVPKVGRKRPRISMAKSWGKPWPPVEYTETEFPPFGNCFS